MSRLLKGLARLGPVHLHRHALRCVPINLMHNAIDSR
jgi:hypothetical protein